MNVTHRAHQTQPDLSTGPGVDSSLLDTPNGSATGRPEMDRKLFDFLTIL
jgi:hypothetical protein